jgi:NhaP-type Na+/H+ or K+/H+ antiporter
VLIVTIVARFVWVMSYNKLMRMHIERTGYKPPRNMGKPTFGSGIVVSWAGMRGIVTLAAAFAIPETLPGGQPFPYRDLILLTAFAVVFGTLVLQGLTLKPLIKWIGLTDNDPVGHEVRTARTEAFRAALVAIKDDETLQGKLLRKEYSTAIEMCVGAGEDPSQVEPLAGPLRRKAIAAARERAIELRASYAIGDDAYHVIEEELDWAELSAGASRD